MVGSRDDPESSLMKFLEGPRNEEKTEEHPSIQIENMVTTNAMERVLLADDKSSGSGGRGQAAMVSKVLDMECHLKLVALDVPLDPV